MEKYSPADSYIRVATACPEVALGDVKENVSRISELYQEAVAGNVSLVTFPELSITGYSLQDLVQQTSLLKQAREGLVQLSESTAGMPTAMVVGLPLEVGNGLFNCAAVLADGRVLGIVPKQNIPNYHEFYEWRWFRPWSGENITVPVGTNEVPFGNNILFDIAGTKVGVEICEDLWIPPQPSIELAYQGAMVIANPSASPEQIGKGDYRRDKLVVPHSGLNRLAYLYAGCDPTESTADIVMGGHQIIASDAQLIAERKPFSRDKDRLLVADIDLDHLAYDRRRQGMASHFGYTVLKSELERQQDDLLLKIDKNPFLPDDEPEEKRLERLEMAFNIQAHGLAGRMRATGADKLVLGLSGGLDSTHALLVAIKAAGILGLDPAEMIETITMPGPASSDTTQSNAQLLSKLLGIPNRVIPITHVTDEMLKAIGHDSETQDITFENVQARDRTAILFNYANKTGAMLLGTGDLSEIAVGWMTYNGDQQSHYNANCTIPKTLMRPMVAMAAEQPEFVAAKELLHEILDQVVAPELVKPENGELQSTDDYIGPLELRDFYLSYVVRYGDTPQKIRYLAGRAFEGVYRQETVDKWFTEFVKRFRASQFKRQNMPDGPKVGSVSLSPRGDWRMPPDLYNSAIWNDD